MTTKELKRYFKDHLVPSKLYKIGGHHKNRDGMCEAALRGLKDISWGRLN